MKVKEIITVTIVGFMVVVFSSNAHAQDKTTFNFGFKPKSESNALLWSFSGTVVPIATGVLWWKLEKPYTVREYTYDGRHRCTYTKEPDRTFPVVLIISGIMVGPSLGYFYGGKADRGMKGILVRVGTGALTMVVAEAINSSNSGGFGDFSGLAASMIVCAVGSGVVLIEAIYDIATVKSTIRKHNEKLRQKNKTSVMLLPKYFADSGAGGLELRINF